MVSLFHGAGLEGVHWSLIFQHSHVVYVLDMLSP